jgi:hypothetical protein
MCRQEFVHFPAQQANISCYLTAIRLHAAGQQGDTSGDTSGDCIIKVMHLQLNL